MTRSVSFLLLFLLLLLPISHSRKCYVGRRTEELDWCAPMDCLEQLHIDYPACFIKSGSGRFGNWTEWSCTYTGNKPNGRYPLNGKDEKDGYMILCDTDFCNGEQPINQLGTADTDSTSNMSNGISVIGLMMWIGWLLVSIQ